MKKKIKRYAEHLLTHPKVVKRFWERIIKPENQNECWGWDASTSSGYGQVFSGTEYQPLRAHRISWAIHFGPIPSGKFVLHRCDVRTCNNPRHLFLGDNVENMKDMCRKGRHRGPIGTVVFTAKLNEEKVLHIRELWKNRKQNGWTAIKLGMEYGVDRSCIYYLLKHGWKHIKGTSSSATTP